MMSLRSQIIEVAEELLRSQGQFTLAQAKEILRLRGVVLPPKSTLVRSTIYEMMKKDPRIRFLDRGVYGLEGWEPAEELPAAAEQQELQSQEETQADSFAAQLEETQAAILAVLARLESDYWLECSDEETLELKRKWALIRSFCDSVECRMSRLTQHIGAGR